MTLSVLHVAPFFDPASQFGGVVSLLRDLCPRLAALGLQVRVVTTDNGVNAEVPRDCWVQREGYEVWYGQARWLERRPPYWSPGLNRILARMVPAADVVHASIGLTLLNAQVRKLARRAGVPYVYTAQGCLCPTRLRRRRWEKKLFVRLVERRILRDAAALQALTEKEAEDYQRQGAARARIHVIPNGVAVGGVADREAGRSFRARFGIPAEAKLVLFLGRLEDVKGLDLLLRALAHVHQRRADVQLAIVGPDFGYEAAARRHAVSLGLDAVVRFTGPVNGAERQAAFGAADIFALTSYSEGLPLAVLEAAACGLPLLITDACQLPEVERYAAGKVVPPRDAAVAHALAELLENPDQFSRMAANARRMVLECFAIETVAQRLASLYRELAQR